MQETIKIGGMTCQNCVERIESELNELQGIDQIKVSLADNEARVDFDPETISLEMIKTKISELGYLAGGKTKTKKSFWQGLLFGLIPHIGCIAFIIGSILGVTVLMNFFKPVLMNRYFFHALVGVSLGFATLSSALYLRKNKMFSLPGIKRKWKYLSVMYGSTIGINLGLFMLIFPLLANVSIASPLTGAAVGIAGGGQVNLIKLKVDIPCPGHAPLISQELQTIEGITGIEYSFPNNFEVGYDPGQTSKQEILSREVFDSYPAKVLEERSVLGSSINENNINKRKDNTIATGSCCGGSGGCGGGCGGGGGGGSCGLY